MMERTIWKYEIRVDDQWHTIPDSLGAVHVGMPPGRGRISQITPSDRVCLWTLVGPGGFSVEVRVFATGQPLPDGVEVVGTAVDETTGLVWHVGARRVGDGSGD